MSVDHDYLACRNLWATALIHAVEDHRRRVQAAASGERGQSVYGLGGAQHVLRPLDAEMAAARTYFTSPDGIEVMSRANCEIPIEKLMRHIRHGARIKLNSHASRTDHDDTH